MTHNATVRKSDTFGTRLREARRQAGYSISRIARELGVDPRTVNRWQSDDAAPSVARLAEIARLLDKPPSYFVDVRSREDVRT